MPNRIRRSLLVLLLVLGTSALAAETASHRPDLVVVISIDQFPYYYIPRFQPWFAEDGFNRFVQHGATYTEARYPYAMTYTGPGHASIGTGNIPARSGIVGNHWYSRLDRAEVYCVDDARSTPAFSPMNLASDSLGDRLQEKYPGAKVFSVAIKDRAAILMAGRKATAAYWLEGTGFTSSTYYRGANAALLATYNQTLPARVAEHPRWEPSSYIPPADLDVITHDPPKLRGWKVNKLEMGTEFPHPVRSLDMLTYTPFGNDLVIALAERILETEAIGTADGTPDLLYLSLSSPDYLGHNFGPDSREAADSVVRTDRDLAAFFRYLDLRFADRYTLVLTADHGVQSIPEVARDMGRDAGRVSFRGPSKKMTTFGELARIAPERIKTEKLVATALGLKVSDATPLDDRFLLTFVEPAFYLNWERIRKLRLDGERVKRAVRESLRKLPGVSGAFTDSELLAENSNPAELEILVRHSFRADRSGDIIVTLKPGYIFDYNGTGTTHGQPVEADRHVPVMLWGRGIKPGTYTTSAAPTDLAKTLGSLLGVDAGGPESHVLEAAQ
jgi:arylsulfatase A-like enzyme